jgi:hypothetical protein
MHSEDLRAEFTVRTVHCLPWPERHVPKHATVFPQGDFILGAAIDVIENDLGETLARNSTEVSDVDNRGSSYRTQSFTYHRFFGLRIPYPCPS